jgi:hypothetical protein
MVKINFFDASTFDRNIKCTIHKSGKIGFSNAAIKRLSIDKMYGVKIGTNEENREDENLYLVCIKDEDKSAFKFIKAGDYYYINAKPLLDEIKIDYRNTKVTLIYDIIDVDIDGEKMYKLIKREVKRRKE